MEIEILELFSGIGGFSVGFERAGYTFKNHYYSEIDKHAIANYKYNFPNAKHIGSVVDIRPGDYKNINIVTFGSPCQDFSLAGKRKGIKGKRSSLIQYAIDIVSGIRPDIFIWENVKGAYSTNGGADFWAIIKAFTNIGGYRLEWQLLNTDWLLPQNRERIYLIGHLATSERGFQKVFPITENDIVFNQEKGTKKGWTQTQNSTTICASGKLRSTDTFIEVPTIAKTITGGGNSGGLHSYMTLIKSATTTGYELAKVGDSVNFSNINSNTRRGRVGKQKSQTIDCNCQQGVLVGTYRTHKDGQGFREVKSGNCPTIPARARKDGSGQPVMVDNQSNIRRLTEIECERLQGFTDNWTKFGNYDGVIKEISQTQRYKMIGNAVTGDIVKLIAERLQPMLEVL